MDALDHVSVDAPGPEDLAIRSELVQSVRTALETLRPDYRQILVLRDIEGRSGPAVAGELGLTIEAQKSRLLRARAALREEIVRAGNAA